MRDLPDAPEWTPVERWYVDIGCMGLVVIIVLRLLEVLGWFVVALMLIALSWSGWSGGAGGRPLPLEEVAKGLLIAGAAAVFAAACRIGQGFPVRNAGRSGALTGLGSEFASTYFEFGYEPSGYTLPWRLRRWTRSFRSKTRGTAFVDREILRRLATIERRPQAAPLELQGKRNRFVVIATGACALCGIGLVSGVCDALLADSLIHRKVSVAFTVGSAILSLTGIAIVARRGSLGAPVVVERGLVRQGVVEWTRTSSLLFISPHKQRSIRIRLVSERGCVDVRLGSTEEDLVLVSRTLELWSGKDPSNAHIRSGAMMP